MQELMYRFFVNPKSGNCLGYINEGLFDSQTGDFFPIVKSIARFCERDNYSESFGFQWNEFSATQIDKLQGNMVSEQRFYAETGWSKSAINEEKVLEVGCGAGRFSDVVLRTSSALLFSIDYSDAVEVNYANNSRFSHRLFLAQASVYEMPFRDSFFDRCFCFGVLQHTPDFQLSVSSLVSKVKVGGEIVVDFYVKKGWYTFVHSKYLLRPIAKRLPKTTLLFLIEKNINWLIKLFDFLVRAKMGFWTRFLPITDLRGLPACLSSEQRRLWAIVDTFDGLTPAYDNPQTVENVVDMFISAGCTVTFAGLVTYEHGAAHVVRAIRN